MRSWFPGQVAAGRGSAPRFSLRPVGVFSLGLRCRPALGGSSLSLNTRMPWKGRISHLLPAAALWRRRSLCRGDGWSKGAGRPRGLARAATLPCLQNCAPCRLAGSGQRVARCESGGRDGLTASVEVHECGCCLRKRERKGTREGDSGAEGPEGESLTLCAPVLHPQIHCEADVVCVKMLRGL